MSSRSAVRIGAQTPSLRHLPADRHDGSQAEDLLELADIAGLPMDPWQLDAAALSVWMRRPPRKGARAKWSASEVAVEVCRQNGKGNIKLLRQLGGLFLFGERLQVHTAHEYKTCYEHFRKLVDVIEAVPDFTRMLKPRTGITTGTQNQAIELRTGQRIRFVARSGKSGRGLTGDTVYLDEAFELDAKQIGALQYTLRARPNPQLWYSSSAPHVTSTVLHALRARAELSTVEEPRLLYLGWGNEPGTDPGDVDAWYRANPALGARIDIETMQNEYRSAQADAELMAEFRREVLGIPELPDVVAVRIPWDVWRACADPASTVPGEVVFAVACSPDRSTWSVGVCGRRADGRAHVAVFDRESGERWIVDDVAAYVTEHRPRGVVVDPTSPAGSIITDLEAKGIEVTKVSAQGEAQGFGTLVDEATRGRLAHRDQPALNAALGRARTRKNGDAEQWDRLASNIAPLDAVTLARWGLDHVPVAATPYVRVRR